MNRNCFYLYHIKSSIPKFEIFWVKTADFISDQSWPLLYQKMVKGLQETGSSDVILVAPRVFVYTIR